MARKRKTRKRHKKGGFDERNRPSPEQRAALRNNISLDRYRHYVRQFNRLNFSTEENSDGPSLRQGETIDQFITRRLGEERQEEERRRARRREAELRRRANRVGNYLPQGVLPRNASMQQVRNAERARTEELDRQREEERKREEQARRQARREADIQSRIVYSVVQNPDGVPTLGSTRSAAEEEIDREEEQARQLRETNNSNTNEIPVTRPSRLRRIQNYLGERIRNIRGRRNRTRVAPRGASQLGGKRHSKKKTRKLRKKIKRRRKRRRKKSKKVRRK
tara:strand:- start:119 stop:955 length:837 start_codon:yes stop_codon:yes gene_type:complete